MQVEPKGPPVGGIVVQSAQDDYRFNDKIETLIRDYIGALRLFSNDRVTLNKATLRTEYQLKWIVNRNRDNYFVLCSLIGTVFKNHEMYRDLYESKTKLNIGENTCQIAGRSNIGSLAFIINLPLVDWSKAEWDIEWQRAHSCE